MKFTDNPLEAIMQQVPKAYPQKTPKAPIGTVCYQCSFWCGIPCVSICYRELLQEEKTSGQVGPMSVKEESNE